MTTPLPEERAPTGSVPAGPHPPTSPLLIPPDTVAVLDWPREAARRVELAATGTPRLLVLGPDDPPPLVWDEAEDWIRADADTTEVRARLTRLALLDRPGAVADPPPVHRPAPVLDADGVLHGDGGRFTVIPLIEARLLHRLLERPRHVVRREALEAAGWPGRQPPPRALDGRITRLRRRVAPFGLHVRTVRGIGHLVEVDPI